MGVDFVRVDLMGGNHSFVQFKISVYCHKHACKQASKQASRHTRAQCSHASVGLARAGSPQ